MQNQFEITQDITKLYKIELENPGSEEHIAIKIEFMKTYGKEKTIAFNLYKGLQEKINAVLNGVKSSSTRAYNNKGNHIYGA